MHSRPFNVFFLTIFLTLAVIASSVAATLMIERTGVDTFDLQTPQNSAVYYFLEDSLDLETFDPFSMALGDTASVWEMNITPELPTRFFRATGISVFAPNDMDGDGIDDMYELRHPLLDPLNPHDAQMLDPEGGGLTFLQVYRQRFGLSSNPAQVYSREVTSFNFGAPLEAALSREVVLFNFGAPLFTLEARSREITIFNGDGGPAIDGFPMVHSREISAYNFGEAPQPGEVLSRELSVFNGAGGPAMEPIPQVYSRELTAFNFGSAPQPGEVLSRELSVFNDIE